MCGFSDDQLRELQRIVAQLRVEQESDGVAQHLPKQSARQMPQITGPHPLYGITLGELTKEGVYPVAKPTEEGAPFRMRLSFLGGVRSQKLYTHTRQLLSGLRRMVVAISNEHTGGGLAEFWEHGKLVGVGRGHRNTGDHP